jgi:uncharacterized protein YndB with AHSA1/START domain
MMTANPTPEPARGVAKTGHAEALADAPPEAVWRVVADVTRTGEWSHECRRVRWLGPAAAPAPGARFRGSNRSGWLRWRRVCEILTADPPRELARRTLSTPLYPDSTEWHILIQPAGPGTRIAESYQVVNPSHIDRAAALDSDLRRLAALAATAAAAAAQAPAEAAAEARDASRQ